MKARESWGQVGEKKQTWGYKPPSTRLRRHRFTMSQETNVSITKERNRQKEEWLPPICSQTLARDVVYSPFFNALLSQEPSSPKRPLSSQACAVPLLLKDLQSPGCHFSDHPGVITPFLWQAWAWIPPWKRSYTSSNIPLDVSNKKTEFFFFTCTVESREDKDSCKALYRAHTRHQGLRGNPQIIQLMLLSYRFRRHSQKFTHSHSINSDTTLTLIVYGLLHYLRMI